MSNLLDTIHGSLEGYAQNTSENIDVGQVNEVTPEQLKKRRNVQLAISIFVILAIAALFYFHKPKN